jgi:GT2 family glycosyltransferase
MKTMKILIAMQAVHANDILKNMTREALGSIKSVHDWGVIVDSRDISLADKWNYALELGKDYDYTFLVNNDILFYEDTLDSVVEFMEKNREYVFVSSNQIFEYEQLERPDGIDENKLHWSFVALRAKEVIEKIGLVDTIFERGSFVDTEWEIRTRKLGLKMCRLLRSRFFHWNDSTHRLLPNYRDVFDSNNEKLIKKWGPGASYSFPYNDSTLDIKFIGHGTKK